MDILRMMYVRDEVDVIERNLRWYAEEELPTVVLDTGSTDGTWEILQEASRDGTVVALERMPSEQYRVKAFMRAMWELAQKRKPSYLLKVDADEFFEVADGYSLRRAMEEDFRAGYNTLRFRDIEFQLTEEDDPNESDVLKRMRYYSYRRTRMYRAFENVPGTDFIFHNGHRPLFPPGVKEHVSPRVYVSRHYPLRSLAQAERKIGHLMGKDGAPTGPSRMRYLLRYMEGYYEQADRLARYCGDHEWELRDRLAKRENKRLSQHMLNLIEERRELQTRYERLVADHHELRRRADAWSGDWPRPGL
jgi:hypothetical protein